MQTNIGDYSFIEAFNEMCDGKAIYRTLYSGYYIIL